MPTPPTPDERDQAVRASQGGQVRRASASRPTNRVSAKGRFCGVGRSRRRPADGRRCRAPAWRAPGSPRGRARAATGRGARARREGVGPPAGAVEALDELAHQPLPERVLGSRAGAALGSTAAWRPQASSASTHASSVSRCSSPSRRAAASSAEAALGIHRGRTAVQCEGRPQLVRGGLVVAPGAQGAGLPTIVMKRSASIDSVTDAQAVPGAHRVEKRPRPARRSAALSRPPRTQKHPTSPLDAQIRPEPSISTSLLTTLPACTRAGRPGSAPSAPAA